MPGLVTRTWEAVAPLAPSAKAVVCAVQTAIPVVVRKVVERYEHAALDSKADREALIKALVEALT